MRGKCIHPRKMTRAMKDFLEYASPITYFSRILISAPANIDFWEWMSKDENWENLEEACSIHLTKLKTDTCCAFLGEYFDYDETVLHFGYSYRLLQTPYYNNYFSTNFRQRCSLAKGFTGITLALLHELGHFMTDEQCKRENPNYNRGVEIAQARQKSTTLKELNEKYYFNLPDEKLATEWAIKWLQDAEHRKIAKAFEKKFFECFEKTS